MAIHECCNCRHIKYLEDENHKTYYFCMFSESPCFLEETGVCGNCDLDGYAEDVYDIYEYEVE